MLGENTRSLTYFIMVQTYGITML